MQVGDKVNAGDKITSVKNVTLTYMENAGTAFADGKATDNCIIRKTKCFRILERNAKISKTKRNFSRLYPTPQKFKKIDRLRRNEIHLKAVRTSS